MLFFFLEKRPIKANVKEPPFYCLHSKHRPVQLSAPGSLTQVRRTKDMEPSTTEAVVCHLNLFSFVFPELPYGWEKIDDPIYGSYYVE